MLRLVDSRGIQHHLEHIGYLIYSTSGVNQIDQRASPKRLPPNEWQGFVKAAECASLVHVSAINQDIKILD